MSDDYDESDDQRGRKVDSIEVKRLKESIKRKDQEWDELVDENKRLKSELRKALSSRSNMLFLFLIDACCKQLPTR